MAMLFTTAHFTTVLLLVTVGLLVRIERHLYGTYLSPIVLIAAPYSLLVAAINFIAIYFGYFTVSAKANLFVILFFLLFFLVGLVIRQMFLRKNVIREHKAAPDQIPGYEFETIFRMVAIVALLAGLLQFRQVIGQIGLINVGSAKFKELFGAGLLGHIMLLSRPTFFFLFVSLMRKWNKVNFALLVSIFLMVVIPQVKYQIIVLLVSSVIYGINIGVVRVTIRKSLFAVLTIYFLFNVSYVIGFSASGMDFAYSDKVQAFLFNHFFTYLFGGPIGFSEILEMKQYPYSTIVELVAVASNIYKAIIGDSQYIQIIIRQWIPISTITQYFHGTNTFGLFGMLYAFAGIAGAGLFTMIYGVLAYTIFQCSLLRNISMAFQMAYAYVGAYLVLSFFGLYLNMLPFYEVLFYIFFLQLIGKTFKALNARRNLLYTDLGSSRRLSNIGENYEFERITAVKNNIDGIA